MSLTHVMSLTTSEKILESFPHTTIHPIIIQPNYESISEVHLNMNANAASVHSHRGNGQLGLLFLMVQLAACNALSNAEFQPPENPGQNPDIANNLTAAQIANILCAHQEKEDELFRNDQTDEALKSQLFAAADDA